MNYFGAGFGREKPILSRTHLIIKLVRNFGK